MCASHRLLIPENGKCLVHPAASTKQCHINQLMMSQSLSARLMKDTGVTVSPSLPSPLLVVTKISFFPSLPY